MTEVCHLVLELLVGWPSIQDVGCHDYNLLAPGNRESQQTHYFVFSLTNGEHSLFVLGLPP